MNILSLTVARHAMHNCNGSKPLLCDLVGNSTDLDCERGWCRDCIINEKPLSKCCVDVVSVTFIHERRVSCIITYIPL